MKCPPSPAHRALVVLLLGLPICAAPLGAGQIGPPPVNGPDVPEVSVDQLREFAFGDATDRNPCPGGRETHTFDVVALKVPIVYNHWGDKDPDGRLFVLRSMQEELLAQIEANPADVADLVQPFVVRAHVGDCVQFNLTNLLPEPVSIHVHSAVEAPGNGMALGRNDFDATVPGTDPDVALPGLTRVYRFFIPNFPGMEGAHFLHSHADSRYHTRHGLFGAVVAEPPGSSWVSPLDGQTPLDAGQEAIIVRNGPYGNPATTDFREHVLIYHDEVEITDAFGQFLPIVSPYGEYGPGTKAINLRTEPFMDRFKLHDNLHTAAVLDRGFDKSQAYGSYTYGDPGVYIPKGYVGDPTKFRLLNAGPGQPHVHHLHGGGDRWRTSPVTDDTQFARGLIKFPAANEIRAKSERVDVQLIGPGESFNAEIEGGAGGVQQGAGDFLYHCHIVEHYVGGMWSFWRVFDTKQDDLAELPDRAGLTPKAVDSVGLLASPAAAKYGLNESSVRAWVESQLPPQGEPRDDDASVWNWTVDETAYGPLYMGEPETLLVWPNYQSPMPGLRPEIRFNPDNGRVAYPLLVPHLGQRPPFAPNHGPAPHLEVPHASAANDADRLCPVEPTRDYKVVALPVPVHYNDQDVDPNGAVFVHAQNKDAVLADPASKARNLVLRANQGECVDITLTSQLNETPENHHHSKVNMHIHLVQFDPQASDGVIAGFNYEQSVRPIGTGAEVARVVAASPAGPNRVAYTVDSVMPFLDARGTAKRNSLVGVGLTTDAFAQGRLVDVDAAIRTITLESEPGKTLPTDVGLSIGYEFVHYRWYADVELGIVYWHDHVDGINGWRHGLFGTLIVEPGGSQWLRPDREELDPTGQADEIEGTVLDILKDGESFREYVVAVQDRSGCIAGPEPSPCSNWTSNPPDLRQPSETRELASFNLRSEPLHRRDADLPFLNAANDGQDPATDLWEAYAGDRVVVRLLYTGQSTSTGTGTFGLPGHWFRYEQHNDGSRLTDAISIGISSHANLRPECGAGGCGHRVGDYLYQMTGPDMLKRGAWGIFRVHDPADASARAAGCADDDGTLDDCFQSLWGSQPVPGLSVPAPSSPRHYDVVAKRKENYLLSSAEPFLPIGAPVNLPMRTNLLYFANASDASLDRPGPLVLRANAGEWVEVDLTNEITGVPQPVSLAPGLVIPETVEDLGIPVGLNDDPTVSTGERTYRWYAPLEVGAAYLASYGRPTTQALEGLFGVLVVEPANASFAPWTGTSATLTFPNEPAAREHVLVYQNDDPLFEASVMPYTNSPTQNADSVNAINYRVEPLGRRLAALGLGRHRCEIQSETCLTDAVALLNILALRPFPGLVNQTIEEVQDALAQQGVSDPTGTIDRLQALIGGLQPETPRELNQLPAVGPFVPEARSPLISLLFASDLLNLQQAAGRPAFGDPDTPTLDAVEGQRLVLRAVQAAGDQLSVHSLAGHYWALDPDATARTGEPTECRIAWTDCASSLASSVTLGTREATNAWMVAGCGGPGDYLYGNHRDPFLEIGQWGILRVAPAASAPSLCPTT